MVLGIGSPAAIAEAPESPTIVANTEDDKEYGKEEILALIAKIAKDDKVLYNNMARLSRCESNFRNIQSLVYKGDKREESYGVAQIHLPSHPEISKEQALDVEWSLNWMASEIKAGRITQWYGYNQSTGKCTNGTVI